jgi:hypothetical protein
MKLFDWKIVIGVELAVPPKLVKITAQFHKDIFYLLSTVSVTQTGKDYKTFSLGKF